MPNIFVLIDALGWKYLEDQQFLGDVLPYRSPLKTVLGFSSGAIPTILTGSTPSVTGHWNLFYYDPQGSPFRWLRFFRFLPDAMLDNRYTRKIIKELGRRVLGMGPLFDCAVSPALLDKFNYIEKRSIYEPGGIEGSLSIFDELKQLGIRQHVYSYHDLTDAQILDQSIRDISAGEAEFYFLYLSEMDMFLHMNCNEPGKIEERLQFYDARLRRVLAAARKVDATSTMTVISDHGMTPIENRYDLLETVTALGLKTPQDYLVVYDSTMARFWFFNDVAKQKIESALADLPCGWIVPEAELRKLGVFFEDRRFGELVFLLHPAWIVSKSDFNGSGWSPKGMHGYHPDDPYSDAIFLSTNEPPIPVSNISDVFVCMEDAAGIGSRRAGRQAEVAVAAESNSTGMLS
jgi:predicted AlkP superfamily pyrophosphatase or phosphodiesterase